MEEPTPPTLSCLVNLRAGAENFLEPLHAEVLPVCRVPWLVVLPADWFSFRSSCRLPVELLGEQLMEATGVELSSELAGRFSLGPSLGFGREASTEPKTEPWTGSTFSGSPLDLSEGGDPVSGSPLDLVVLK